MAKKRNWTRFIIPGLIFQSVLIGGGYGTGAEIAAYFGTSGMIGGILGIIVTAVFWAILCAITFEFTRTFKTYDYGSMMGQLLGKAGILYDICYWVMMFIVLGVINATAGSMLSALTGLPPAVGVGILAVGTVFLVIKGTETIEKVLSFWSYVLYVVYILFMIIVFAKFGGNISAEFSNATINSGWFMSGLKYAFYNLVCLPIILYTVRDAESRGEAVKSGILAGILGAIPALLLLLTFGASMSAVVAADTPVTVIFDLLDMKWLYILFEVVLFGTLIETGTGFIKAVDDRLEAAMLRRRGDGAELPSWVRPVIAVVFTVIGICISTFGLTGLIAKGYGTICWGFLILFAIPMIVIGTYKIKKYGKPGKID